MLDLDAFTINYGNPRSNAHDGNDDHRPTSHWHYSAQPRKQQQHDKNHEHADQGTYSTGPPLYIISIG